MENVGDVLVLVRLALGWSSQPKFPTPFFCRFTTGIIIGHCNFDDAKKIAVCLNTRPTAIQKQKNHHPALVRRDAAHHSPTQHKFTTVAAILLREIPVDSCNILFGTVAFVASLCYCPCPSRTHAVVRPPPVFCCPCRSLLFPGFPIRRVFDEFMQRYGAISPSASNIDALLYDLVQKVSCNDYCSMYVPGMTQNQGFAREVYTAAYYMPGIRIWRL